MRPWERFTQPSQQEDDAQGPWARFQKPEDKKEEPGILEKTGKVVKGFAKTINPALTAGLEVGVPSVIGSGIEASGIRTEKAFSDLQELGARVDQRTGRNEDDRFKGIVPMILGHDPTNIDINTIPDAIKSTGRSIHENAQARQRDNADLQMPKELEGRDWKDLLSDSDTAGQYLAWQIGYNGPNTAAVLAASVGAGVVGGPVAAGATAYGMSFLMESGSSFEELKRLTGNEEEAAMTARTVGMVSGLLDAAPIGRLISKVPGLRKLVGMEVVDELVKKPLLRRVLTEAVKQGAYEAATEALQEVVHNAGKRVYDKNQDLLEGTGESAFVGGMIGALTGGAFQVHRTGGGDQDKPDPNLIDPKRIGLEPGLYVTPEGDVVSRDEYYSRYSGGRGFEQQTQSPPVTPDEGGTPVLGLPQGGTLYGTPEGEVGTGKALTEREQAAQEAQRSSQLGGPGFEQQTPPPPVPGRPDEEQAPILGLPAPSKERMIATPSGQVAPESKSDQLPVSENIGLTPDVRTAQQAHPGYPRTPIVDLPDTSQEVETPQASPVPNKAIPTPTDYEKLADATENPVIKQDLMRQAEILRQQQRGEEPKLTPWERRRLQALVDPGKDDLVTAIRKLGGIDTDVETDWAGRLKPAEEKAFGLPGIERPGKGRSLDDLAETLMEYGYVQTRDKRELEQKLSDIETGVKVFSLAMEDQQREQHYLDGLGIQRSDEEPEVASLDELMSTYAEIEKELAGNEPQLGVPDTSRLLDELGKLVDDIDPDLTESILERAAQQNVSDKEVQKQLLDIIRRQLDEQSRERRTALAQRPAPEERTRRPAERQPGVGTQAQGRALAQQQDLVGKTEAQQRAQPISDKQKEREQRVQASPPVESGEGDLFSGRAKQVDITDQIAANKKKGADLTKAVSTYKRDNKPSDTEISAFQRGYQEASQGKPNEVAIIEQTLGDKEATAYSEGRHAYHREFQSYIDEESNKAATSPTNNAKPPSPPQQEKGNYLKGHPKIHGLDISIENPRGSTRRSKPGVTPAWESKLTHHYGYIRGTKDRTGEHIDVFVGKNPESEKAFVIDQATHGGKFDEYKVMLGFKNRAAARQGYLSNYPDDWRGLDSITETTVDKVKKWLETGDTKKPFNMQPKKFKGKDVGVKETAPKYSNTELKKAFESRKKSIKGADTDAVKDDGDIRYARKTIKPGADRRADESGQSSLFGELPDDKTTAHDQMADTFHVRYKQVEVGSMRHGLETVGTASEAAHVLAPIRKHGQELFVALVLDKNKAPISVFYHGKGIKDGATVDPLTVAGAVVNTPGAHSVWYGHNHPSGGSSQSRSDISLTLKITQMFDESGVRVNGHVILGRGTEAHHLGPDGTPMGPIKIHMAPRNTSTPVTERIIRKQPVGDLITISNEKGVIDLVRSLDSDHGIVLLNTRHGVVGVISMTPEEMSKLRENGRVARILKAFDISNAGASMVFSKQQDVEPISNVVSFLKSKEIRVIDAITKDAAGHYRSSVATGDVIHERNRAWYSRGKPAGKTLSVDTIRSEAARIAEALNLSDDLRIRVHENWNRLPSHIRAHGEAEGDTDTIKAVFDRKNNTVHILSSGIRSIPEIEEQILHEAAGHFGFQRLFDDDVMAAAATLFDRLGGRTGIKQLADKYGLDMDDYFRIYDENTKSVNWDDVYAQVYLVDEFLANMQGNKAYDSLGRKIIRAIQEFLGAVRDALRRLGFVNLSKVSDSDIALLLRRMMNAARKPTGRGDGVRYSRDASDLKKGGIYYSTLLSAAKNINQETGTPEQMMAMLKKSTGVKQEEIDWLGVAEWIAGQPKVKKSDLVDFIEANQVQVTERMLGVRTNEQRASKKADATATGKKAGKKGKGGAGARQADRSGIKFNRKSRTKTPTNTDSFKAWFGDSKVVDDDGKPLVVHHGGIKAKDIEIFDTRYGGETTGNNEIGAFHFTDDIEVAEDYSRQAFIRRYGDYREGLVTDGIITPEGNPDYFDMEVDDIAEDHISRSDVYIKIENPIVIDMKGQVVDVLEIEEITKFAMTGKDDNLKYFDRYIDQIYASYPKEDIEYFRDEIEQRARDDHNLEPDEEIDDWQFDSAVDEFMQENGYEREMTPIDGVIVKNMVDNIGDRSNKIATQYIVFDPLNIKSIYNEGSWSTTNENIRFNRSTSGLTPEEIAARERRAARKAKTPEGREPTPPSNGDKPAANRFGPSGFDVPQGSRLWDELVFQAQDKFNYLSKVQKAAAAARNIESVPESEDAYLAELRYHGRAGARIEDFQRDHVDPILKLMSDNNLTVEDVDLYLRARHAQEANAQLKRINPDRQDNDALSGMSDKEASDIIGKFKNSKNYNALQDIAERVDAITKARRDMLVVSGLETQGAIDAWESTYQYYVPLRRAGFADRPPSRGKGFQVRGKEKRRAGSTRDVIHVLANVVAQYEATVIRGEKVEVGRTLLEFARNNPNPGLYEIDKVEYTPHFDSDGLVTYRASPNMIDAENVLVVPENGVNHRITFNPTSYDAMRVAYAMKNLGADDIGVLMRALHTFTRFLAMVNTSLNPEFVISNFARDVQTAGYNLSDTEARQATAAIIRDVGKAWHGIRRYQKHKEAGNEWAKHYKEFRDAGAQTGWIEHYRDVSEREQDLLRKIKHMQKGTYYAVRRGITSIREFVESENTAVENAVRLSAYVHARRIGLSEAKSARLAKELTVNFNKKGNSAFMINALYMFYNASIQGTVRMLKALKRRPVRRFVYATVVGAAILDIINRAIGGDDDDKPKYDFTVPDYIKERNLVIMRHGGDGDYFKIPLPWGYNVFHVIGQEIGSAFTKDGWKASDGAMRIAGAISEAFNPLSSATILQFISPTITDPIVQWAENKNWYGGKVRPDDNPFGPNKPDSQKYFNNVREPSRWVTEKLNELFGGDETRPGAIDISPAAIDLTIDTLTGGAGRFVADTFGTPIKAIMGDEIETSDIPLLRKLYSRPGTSDIQREYYENADAMRNIDHWHKEYIKDRETDKANAIRQEFSREFSVMGQYKSVDSSLKKLRKRRKHYEELGDDKSANEIRDIEKRRMKEFNDAYYKNVIAPD